MITYDNARQQMDGGGNIVGVPLGARYRTHDGKWADSTGAFLVGELERLDQTLNEPLASIFFGRDIDLREDVTIADEVSSFTLSNFGSQGSLGTGNGIGNGKAWIGKDTNQITGLSLDIAKIPHPLRLWGMELKYTIPELESAAKLGRPIDQQKYEGLQLKHQMDIDEQAYIGDTTTTDTGLLNNTLVTNVNMLPAGAAGSTNWVKKAPQEILADVNAMLTSVWTASAYAVTPNKLIIPPTPYGYIATQPVTAAGSESIKTYVEKNNLLTSNGRGRLIIEPSKWAIGAGVGGTLGTQGTVDRATVYTKDKKYVRLPLTMLQRTPVQFDSLYHKTTYFCRIGVVEVVYPETIGYFDGL